MVFPTRVGKPSLYEDFTDEISSDFGDIDFSQGQRKARPCHWLSKVTIKQWLCAGLVLLLALLLIFYLLWRYVVSRSAISSAINGIRWTLIEMKTDGKPFQCGPEADTICLKTDFEILAVNPSATWMTIEPSPTDLYYKDTYLAQIRTPAFTLPDGGQETVRFTTNLGGLNNETYKHLVFSYQSVSRSDYWHQSYLVQYLHDEYAVHFTRAKRYPSFNVGSKGCVAVVPSYTGADLGACKS
ncbi:hypothetical protein FOL46_008161 [Perkinsus olseni]|uniref:Uncharacterized protein n=1 Tax=Perkinsus olseni TaxID=32597 RepID=A0A7J6MMT6_PEROL|nr:hypothetical protein FOL46_008161 [Perkinsus olseni]